jgi:hypothetical protein
MNPITANNTIKIATLALISDMRRLPVSLELVSFYYSPSIPTKLFYLKLRLVSLSFSFEKINYTLDFLSQLA